MKYTFYSVALMLLVACGPSKKTQEEKPTVVTEDLKADNPGEVTQQGAGAGQNHTDPTEVHTTKTESVEKPAKPVLHGSWELEKVYGAKEPFNMLFPNKKPTATFDLKAYTLNGNNGCNQYNGPFTLRNGVLGIGDMMATKMFCEGVKEQLYMTTLKMANGYKFEADKLILTLDNEAILGFKPIK